MNATTPKLRWSLVLTNSETGDRVTTFTWGRTRDAALSRVADHLEAPLWDGYSFELAAHPSGT